VITGTNGTVDRATVGPGGGGGTFGDQCRFAGETVADPCSQADDAFDIPALNAAASSGLVGTPRPRPGHA